MAFLQSVGDEAKGSPLLPLDQYRKVAESLPILCVDVIVLNASGEYLLVKRANEPLKGEWWVIGGRVFKNEPMAEAAIRKVKEEVGLHVTGLKPVGFYEEVFMKNPYGITSGLHTVSVVFEARSMGESVRLDEQSSGWKFAKALPPNLHINYF